MIFIGIGSNLASAIYGSPMEICEASIELLNQENMTVFAKSSWYNSAPIPASPQPDFINGIIGIETDLKSLELLSMLLEIESLMGRERSVRDAARIIDIDLLAYNDEIVASEHLHLPHPRMHERAFVIAPLAEIAPDWHHPASGKSILELLAPIADQKITRI